MPQNKPMKIQWITVNGRQVPLVLPQTYSYADNDWKVTSDRDPLPVVEYGTTAGGIVVPKRVSDEGHELTQLTGSNARDQNHVIILPRQIYNTSIPSPSASIDVPQLAKGAIFHLRVFGVTGNFSENQGAQLRIRYNFPISNYTSGLLVQNQDVISRAGMATIVIYPSASLGDGVSNSSSNNITCSGMPLPQKLLYHVNISGTFNEGEGLDMMLVVEWLY